MNDDVIFRKTNTQTATYFDIRAAKNGEKARLRHLHQMHLVYSNEDGLDAIDVPAFPLAIIFGDVLNAIEQLATQEHDRKTVVLDSVDWLERLIFEQLCKERNVKQ